MRIYGYALLLTGFFWFSGCNKGPLNVDVSGIEPHIEFMRLDQDLFALNPADGQTDTRELQEKYGAFFTDYCDGMLRIGNPSAPSFPYAVAQFISDESILTLQNDCEEEFSDLSNVETELTSAFRYFKYHFPDSMVPQIVFNVSALNYAVVSTKSTLAIGLDMFLGADYPVYPQVGMPKYMFSNMKRSQIVPQAMKGWFQSMFETDAKRSTLLEYMVYEGKILYLLDAVLRDSPDSVKIGFSPEAMSWCKTYESQIWAHLVGQKLIYTTENMTINKWINQAPFVAGIPKESPGRLGQWVGWQIVRKYMESHPEVSPQQLMNDQDAQQILSESKYKPKI